MAENFDLIFGQNASQQYAWNDADYQNGWETIGNIPPTAAQFDALQRRSDTKLKELNDELTPLVNADTADSRQPSTAYAVGDMRCYGSLPYGWYLECTAAGTTGGGDIALPTPLAENATVMDGTVTWKVRKISSADELAGKADRSLSNLTDAGKSFSFPSDTYVDISSYVNSGTAYTAPADGYVYINGGVTTATNGYVNIYVNGVLHNQVTAALSVAVSLRIATRKGQSILLESGDVQKSVAYFYYAQGEVPA